MIILVLLAPCVTLLLARTCWGVTLTDPSQLLTYDYIIVGAGTAGLTVATRLTENSSISVLVIEAGGSDQGVLALQAPFLGPTATPNSRFDWNYTVVPQSGLQDRVFSLPCGRVLGGSSSINYLVHQYGTNDDWNRIANVVGDQGWAWENMKQYVAKHENLVSPADGHDTTGQIIPSLHSTAGLLPVSLPGVNFSIDSRVMATTGQLAEFPFNEDMSGLSSQLLGLGFLTSSIGGGIRSSASTAYLAPVNTRPNLTVLINTTVLKLLQTGTSSAGLIGFRSLQFTESSGTGATFTATARKQVILSAGAIGTAKLLMLSGVGSPPDLTALGIPVLINNTAVGGGFMDSTFLPNYFSVNQTTLDATLRNVVALNGLVSQWITTKTGLLSNNIINTLGYARLPANSSILSTVADPAAGPTSPHYEYIPTNFFIEPGAPFASSGSFISIVTTLSAPTSRGNIKLRSSNPFDPPLIDPKYLSQEIDVVIMRESVKAALRFMAAPAWADMNPTPVGGLANLTTDASIDAYVSSLASTIFHPAGSAMMTNAAIKPGNGVVNPDLTVKGADGLRVVDASVWPFLPSTHPQGALYLLAERASDIIKAGP